MTEAKVVQNQEHSHRNLNANCEVPNRVSRFDSLPCQQPVLPQWTVQTSSLPKLKMTEFAGDPLEWPEWSSLFIAVIHNAPINDNAKMSHLKTLVKGKAKAAIAGLGYSGALYHTAWDTLVRNFGRPQTVVNAQMKLIHTYHFIKSHDSAAIIKYAELITTCVSVLNQYGFTGDLSSVCFEQRRTKTTSRAENEMVVLCKRTKIPNGKLQ